LLLIYKNFGGTNDKDFLKKAKGLISVALESNYAESQK
jgi:hypothetical protein